MGRDKPERGSQEDLQARVDKTRHTVLKTLSPGLQAAIEAMNEKKVAESTIPSGAGGGVAKTRKAALNRLPENMRAAI